MKSKQLVLIAIALLCGLVSAIGIIQAMGNKVEVAAKIPMGPVIVASSHLDHKAKLDENNVSLENWPINLIPEGAATEIAQVDGKHITTRLRTGQAIILEDVMSRSEIPGLAIPPNHKVINIKVPPEDTLAGLLRPGDRVDIIGIFSNGRGRGAKTEPKTFLKGIRVFNIGMSTSAQDQRKNGASGIVGVLVTAKQAEKIVWAKSNGTIRLAMIGDNVASSGPDPDFPLDEKPEEEEVNIGMPSIEGLFQSFTKKPALDKSKLHQVKVYNAGKLEISYFDENGSEVKFPSDHDGGGQISYESPMLNGARGLPPVDYEASDDSAEVPNGIEEDQYQGE